MAFDNAIGTHVAPANTRGKPPCTSFGTSSRGRKVSDPARGADDRIKGRADRGEARTPAAKIDPDRYNFPREKGVTFADPKFFPASHAIVMAPKLEDRTCTTRL